MKSELFNKISFHESEIKGYKKDGSNIIILIKDGWEIHKYFKIKLKNVKVEVMNNKKELICYTLDRFYNIFKKGDSNLIDGGQIGTHNDDNKYYLKLYIDWPCAEDIQNQNTIEKYQLDGFSVYLCDDYNDTGDLYIKFIMDDFEVEEI